MSDERSWFKWLLVILPVVAALLAIYPPDQKLKAGIDLAGGSSLLFEIDTAGLEDAEKVGLSNRVMEVLKRRVDPGGQMNLIWRPIGNNRLEIQMPRPPKAALERRDAYDAARDKLRALNVTRLSIENMLSALGAEREQLHNDIVHVNEERTPLVDNVIEKFDAYQAAKDGDDYESELTARSAYDDALAELMGTSLDPNRLADVLALKEEQRAAELGVIRSSFDSASYKDAIDEVVAAYDEWAKNKAALEDPSDLKRRIKGAGVLEFRILAERDTSNPTMTAVVPELITKYTDQLQKRGARPRPGDRYAWFEVADLVSFTNAKTPEEAEERATSQGYPQIVDRYVGRWYVLAHAEKNFALLADTDSRWKLVGAFPSVDPSTGAPAVIFRLDPRGGQQFAKMTSENLKRPLSIFLDDVAQNVATIQSMIREQGQISGTAMSQDEVNELVMTLRAGALPARVIPDPVMEQTVGPQLGETNRKLGMRAAIIGGVAVAIFILIYYQFAGIVANIALALNVLLVLGIMAGTQATFTLPGIAGLILTVGMAVDANVLIFERIREELDRGMGLRKALRTGYDRALSTIVDANVTTLITCVILGYLGTEEVKGFAMVLGFGIATSMFTALFVTRLIFGALIDRGVLSKLSMMRIISKPSVDWLSLRKSFWPISCVLVTITVTITLFTGVSDPEALFDIEFLGGTSVQIEFKQGQGMSDEEVRQALTSRDGDSAIAWLENASEKLASADVRSTQSSEFTISSDSLSGDVLEALVRHSLQTMGITESGGFQTGSNSLTVFVKDEHEMDLGGFKAVLAEIEDDTRKAAGRLASARIQSVGALDDGASGGDAFEIITVETNKDLVRTAVLAVLGDKLDVQQSVAFAQATDPRRAPDGFWPIEEEDHLLSDVVADTKSAFDLRPFKGGLVMVYENVHPPISEADFKQRIREIRLLPEFSAFEARPYEVLGLTKAGGSEGETTYSKLAYIVVDENLPYYDSPENWEESLATKEAEQVRQALATEKALRKVIHFEPQIAAQTQNQAVLAIVMALACIVAYIWIRFGQMQWGLAAVVCLVHDVAITLGLVTMAHYLANSPIGAMLGLMDFKIDLAMIAAFLTIIGYSLNDTIVVFDRIRENRGKLKSVTAPMINNSINQTLSRTMLTSLTTFMAIMIMYIFGGPGIRGFSFAIAIGLLSGTYSSIGVAAPLLNRPKVLHNIIYLLIAVSLFGAVSMVSGGATTTFAIVAGVVLAAGFVWALMLENRKHAAAVPAT